MKNAVKIISLIVAVGGALLAVLGFFQKKDGDVGENYKWGVGSNPWPKGDARYAKHEGARKKLDKEANNGTD